MYLFKIRPDQMEKLYLLREEKKEQGEKSSIAQMVREGVDLKIDLEERKKMLRVEHIKTGVLKDEALSQS